MVQSHPQLVPRSLPHLQPPGHLPPGHRVQVHLAARGHVQHPGAGAGQWSGEGSELPAGGQDGVEWTVCDVSASGVLWSAGGVESVLDPSPGGLISQCRCHHLLSSSHLQRLQTGH